MSTKKLQIVSNLITTDKTLTQSDVAADAKIVGDLWRTYPDDNDVAWLLEQIGLSIILSNNALDNALLDNLILE